jgi:epoxide hydrolase
MADWIEPFVIAADGAALDDLRNRFRRTRWPERETVDGWSQGRAAGLFAGSLPLLGRPLRLAGLGGALEPGPALMTRIDGMDEHFLHILSPHPGRGAADHDPPAGRDDSLSSSWPAAR